MASRDTADLVDARPWCLVGVQLPGCRRLRRLRDFRDRLRSRLVCQLGEMDGCRALVPIRFDAPKCLSRCRRLFVCVSLASQSQQADGIGEWCVDLRIWQLHWAVSCPNRWISRNHVLGPVCDFRVDDRSRGHRVDFGTPNAKSVNRREPADQGGAEVESAMFAASRGAALRPVDWDISLARTRVGLALRARPFAGPGKPFGLPESVAGSDRLAHTRVGLATRVQPFAGPG